MINLKEKNVLVLGLARSGMAAIRLLHKHGAHITLNESKQEENLNVIIEEVDRLTILVNDILDLSKLKELIIKIDECINKNINLIMFRNLRLESL